MAHIYLDPSTIVLRSPGREVRAVPGATDALRTLQDGGDEVVVIGDVDAVVELPDGVGAATSLPADPGSDAWFLTGDPDTLAHLPVGMRTILVGPRRAPGVVPLPRFDVEARDLPAAVMEVLTRQAMR